MLKQALDLFQDGKSVNGYYWKNPQEYNHQVARQLRGMRIRNGMAAGGMLGQGESDRVISRRYVMKKPAAPKHCRLVSGAEIALTRVVFTIWMLCGFANEIPR